MPDDALSVLDDILFPGGKPSKVVMERRKAQIPEPQVVGGWDAHPKTVMMGGEEREFFRVSALAHALGKSVKTIYAWETQGKIPFARYRSAVKRDALKDKAAKGDRLYTRYQIEATVAAAKQTGVISGKRTNWPRFTALVKDAWAK